MNFCENCEKPIMVTVPLSHLEAKDQHIALLNRRYLKAIIAIVMAALILLFAEAGIFVWLWNQYDYGVTETTVDTANDNAGTINGGITVTANGGSS